MTSLKVKWPMEKICNMNKITMPVIINGISKAREMCEVGILKTSIHVKCAESFSPILYLRILSVIVCCSAGMCENEVAKENFK